MPHPHQHPQPGPARGRIVAHFTPDLTRGDYAALLRDLGETLAQSSALEINGQRVTLANSLQFELVYERTPHGAMAFVLRVEWPEEQRAAESASRLSITVAGNQE